MSVTSAAPVSRSETLSVRQGILRAVAYSDVFDHPLTAAEIHRYLVGTEADRAGVEAQLRAMVPSLLETEGELYFLRGRKELVELRRERTERATRAWPHARYWGHRIANLPFVKMVAVTGSLSRDSADEGADVDYLVVAGHGRVWVCRALIGLLTRRALRRGVTLCVNYILSDNALALGERDIYTAVELVQMVPLVGPGTHRRMLEANPWIREFLPNGSAAIQPEALPEPPVGPRRRLVERLLRTPPGGWLDRLERARKLRRSLRQGHDLAEARFEPGCFKGHFDGHAARTLLAYHERLRPLEEEGP